jgi:lon-related putative ATP-dependent protease
MPRPVPPLLPAALRRRCDPAALRIATTAELEDLPELPGQGRALGALRFGVGLRAHDYNIFAVGSTGLGKHAVVRAMLEERAAADPVPDDWCYVHGFADRRVPQALRVPQGRAPALREALDGLVGAVRAKVRAFLDGEDGRGLSRAVAEEVARHHGQVIADIEEQASRHGFRFEQGAKGSGLITPVRDGEPVGTEEFEALPDPERIQIEAALVVFQQRVEGLLRESSEWARSARARARAWRVAAVADIVHRTLVDLRGAFGDLAGVVAFLDDVERDLAGRAADLLESESREHDDAESGEVGAAGLPELPLARRYRVNVLTSHGAGGGAPVIYEDHPTYPNLFGRVEHVQLHGALLTDHSMITAGALHRANGGYLILDALQVLQQPFVWDALKRALRARQLRIEAPLDTIGLSTTFELEPAPIPLDVKVVLMSERGLHHLLVEADPDVRELFKVQADFADELPWDGEAETTYARLLATIARREKTRPLDAGAVARIIEEGARWAGDRQRLSLDLQGLSDLVREANQWWAASSGDAASHAIRAAHVERALAERTHRADRARQELVERVGRGILLLATTGEAVGQVNGLSVLQVADFVFGCPVRITARARLGKGSVLDIEREVALGGPIHSKGVLILGSFLGARYAADVPLSLSASLVFEQSYSGIEGDSASAAELCCLLSAIADVGLRQDIAVTGSVNQHGEVQPVGGVDEKVEGFFDVCRRTGLTGRQGVIVPRANLDHLMLRQDVVDAVVGGHFQVWSVRTVDEILELLTSHSAGARGADGSWTEGSFNARVQARLDSLAEGSRTRELQA